MEIYLFLGFFFSFFFFFFFHFFLIFIFLFRLNSYGQLGTNDYERRNSPTFLINLPKICLLNCGKKKFKKWSSQNHQFFSPVKIKFFFFFHYFLFLSKIISLLRILSSCFSFVSKDSTPPTT